MWKTTRNQNLETILSNTTRKLLYIYETVRKETVKS